jgi:hypothetical protein
MQKAIFARESRSSTRYRLKSLQGLTSIPVTKDRGGVTNMEVGQFLSLKEMEDFRVNNPNVTVVVQEK